MSDPGGSDLGQGLNRRFRSRHILLQAGSAGGKEVVGIALRYLLVLVIVRLFGAEGLGVYTLAIASASLAALVGRIGLDHASLRFTALHHARGELSQVVGVNLFATVVTTVLGIAAAVLLFAASEPIEAIWQQPGLANAVRLSALAVPAISLGEVWRDGLRGLQDVRLASLIEKVVIPAAGILLVFALLSVGPTPQPLASRRWSARIGQRRAWPASPCGGRSNDLLCARHSRRARGWRCRLPVA